MQVFLAFLTLLVGGLIAGLVHRHHMHKHGSM